jgi:hypothetical protein
MINVLLVSKKDWANVGYEIQEALRSVGVKALSVHFDKHRFEYPNTSYVCNDVSQYAIDADIIQFMHSVNVNLGIGDQFDGRKGVAVFHGGSGYRTNPDQFNTFWNQRAQVTLIQTGDLLNIGEPPAKNKIWFLPPIDTDTIQPDYSSRIENKRIITHCPSRSAKKGTIKFNKLMDKLSKDKQLKDKFVYNHVRKWADWSTNIERMKICDIYFDACMPKIGVANNTYGEWGISTLEACSLGKAVISHFLSHERYKQEFGIDCPIQHANNFEEVEKQIRNLILMGDDEFMELRKKTRFWVVENHSREIIGQRLVDIYNEYLTWKGKDE